MASGFVPDIWNWIKSLPKHWRGEESHSLQICTSPSTNQSLNLVISRQPETEAHSFILSFSICDQSRDHDHDPVPLWSSRYSKLKPANTTDVATQFLQEIICGVLRYGPYFSSRAVIMLPNVHVSEDSSKILCMSVLTLALLVCVYEAPSTLRREFMGAITARLTCQEMRRAARELMLALGSSLEEQWMRSVNLGVTNWVMEARRSGTVSSPRFAVFSYALSASRLWKVQVYCPVVAMAMEHYYSTHHQHQHQQLAKDERLLFSLNYQQLESVIQFVYRVSFRENWIDVAVNVDNIRCDVIQLVSETLMARQGYGSDEKHFPSRISLQLTPLEQSDILSMSVSRSSDNPAQEVGTDKGIDTTFGAAPGSIGISMSAHETVTRSMKPWKFEHSVHGNTASLSWFLHGGGGGGREVFSSEPPKLELFQPRSWFRNRYTSPSRPFTRSGGVIFAGDEYGESVCWRMGAAAAGKTMEWEIKGRIWVTYWPNKKRTLHTETRRLEFRELLHLSIAE
uniref:Uncharacterized protein n=1 Tax=Avena sativa TaxID=4498 RepID=A0ACD5YWV8_AVESA